MEAADACRTGSSNKSQLPFLTAPRPRIHGMGCDIHLTPAQRLFSSLKIEFFKVQFERFGGSHEALVHSCRVNPVDGACRLRPGWRHIRGPLCPNGDGYFVFPDLQYVRTSAATFDYPRRLSEPRRAKLLRGRLFAEVEWYPDLFGHIQSRRR